MINSNCKNRHNNVMLCLIMPLKSGRTKENENESCFIMELFHFIVGINSVNFVNIKISIITDRLCYWYSCNEETFPFVFFLFVPSYCIDPI